MNLSRLRVAVIGVGHLGKEHARILAGMADVELVGVADVNGEQAQAVARRLGTQAFTDYWPLLNLVDAASIVVPTMHHKAVAAEFLRRHIPLLVEKPLAANHAHSRALVELAGQNDTILQVGHIERFNPAFEELQRRPLQPKFVTCERFGPFSGRSTDIGVVLDLMIHDLDLLLALVKSPVAAVEALGISLFGRNEDVANARLLFANGCVAQLSASRASPTPLCQHRFFEAAAVPGPALGGTASPWIGPGQTGPGQPCPAQGRAVRPAPGNPAHRRPCPRSTYLRAAAFRPLRASRRHPAR